MFHKRRHGNNRINNIQERAVRAVYKDDISFDEYKTNKKSFEIHHINILALELHKTKHKISPFITRNIFTIL